MLNARARTPRRCEKGETTTQNRITTSNMRILALAVDGFLPDTEPDCARFTGDGAHPSMRR